MKVHMLTPRKSWRSLKPQTTTARPATTTKLVTRINLPKMKAVRKHVTGWTVWTHWSPCNRSCGGGIQTRERVCQKSCPYNTLSGKILTYHQDLGRPIIRYKL